MNYSFWGRSQGVLTHQFYEDSQRRLSPNAQRSKLQPVPADDELDIVVFTAIDGN